jgi:hypothetical protein
MFDFPSNPTADQAYISGGASYRWKGQSWDRAGMVALVFSSINPNQLETNNSSTSATITGSGFTPTTKTIWDGVDVGFFYISPTSGSVSIPVSAVVKTSTIFLTDSGRNSKTLQFNYISATAPRLNFIDPASIISNGASHQIDYIGAGFAANTVAFFKGVAVPTTFVAADRLRITQTAPVVGTIETCECKAQNPTTGEFSNSINFVWTATQNTPAIFSVVPNYALSYYNYNNWEVTVQGINASFTADAKVFLNGTDMKATFLSPNNMRFWMNGSQWPVNDQVGYPLWIEQVGGKSNEIPFYIL